MNQVGDRPKYFWLRLVGTVISLILLVFLIVQQDYSKILKAFQEINMLFLIYSLISLLISRLAISVRWHLLLTSGGGEINLVNTLKLVFAGLFANNFLPSTIGGDAVRVIGSIRQGLDKTLSITSVALDRLIGLITMSTMVPLGIFALRSDTQTLTLFRMPVLVGGAIFTKAIDWLKKSLGGIRALLLAWSKQPRILIASAIFSYLHMAFLFLSIHFILKGLGEGVSVWLIAGLWSLIYLVTLLPISINGLGIQEVSLTFLFSKFGGVTESNAIILSILIRILFLITSLPGVIFLSGIMTPTQKSETQYER